MQARQLMSVPVRIREKAIGSLRNHDQLCVFWQRHTLSLWQITGCVDDMAAITYRSS